MDTATSNSNEQIVAAIVAPEISELHNELDKLRRQVDEQQQRIVVSAQDVTVEDATDPSQTRCCLIL